MKRILVNILYYSLLLDIKIDKKIFVLYFFRFIKYHNLFKDYIICYNDLRSHIDISHNIRRYLMNSVYYEKYFVNKITIFTRINHGRSYYNLKEIDILWQKSLINLKWELIKYYFKYGSEGINQALRYK